MAEKSREDQIRKLKAMRAELMAIKEQMDSGDGDDEAASASLASIRKNYAEEFDETRQQGETLDDAKREVYSQYESEEQTNNEEQGKKLVRGLRR